MTTAFPIEALRDGAAIIGKTGSGKSYTARGIVEQLIRRQERTVIVDPTGVWWGLRLSFDGMSSSGTNAVVLGGAHADLPITEHQGETVGELVGTADGVHSIDTTSFDMTAADVKRSIIEPGLCVVIDISEFSGGERRRFMTGFLAKLYQCNRVALNLIVDEADEFAPQRPMPDQTVMFSHLDRIVRRGRVRGFRPILITQRPAVLHKDVLSQMGTLVAMRMTSSQDRNAIKAWIDGQADRDSGREIIASLPGLKVGQGWIWAPSIGVLEKRQFPTIGTWDSMKTPEHGAAGAAVHKLPPVGVAAWAAILSMSQEPAKSAKGQHNRAREAELQAEVDRLVGELADMHGRYTTLRERAASAITTARALLATLDIEQATEPSHDFSALAYAVASKTAVDLVPRMITKTAPPGAGDVTDPERRVLAAVRWWEAAGIDTPTRHQVAFVAGYTVNGHYSNTLGGLKQRGLIEYRTGGTVSLTAEGSAKAPAHQGAPSRESLIGLVLEVLRSEPQRRLFSAVAQHRKPITREALAAACGYTVNGHFSNTLGQLRSLGVICVPTAGAVALAPMFDAFKGAR